MEGIVVEHIIILSELSVTYASILSFISDGSFSKLILLQSKLMNPFEKYYSNILLGHFSITTESLPLKNPRQDIKLINRSGIPIPNMLS